MNELTAEAVLARATHAVQTFARNDLRTSPVLERFVGGLTALMNEAGYTRLDAPGPGTNVVLHSIDADAPRPYRRKAAPTFVIAIAELDDVPEDRIELLRVGYPLLVRALANLCVMVSDTADGLVVRFVTLEQGVYGVGPGCTDEELAHVAFDRIEPLASSQLVIANDFVTDLPRHLWSGDEQTAQMLRAGRALESLDLLPAPFPIEDILAKRELRHVELLYGIGGLSYGNVERTLRGRRHLRIARPRGARLLDERERRRQGRPQARRTAHPARAGLRRRPRNDGLERPA